MAKAKNSNRIGHSLSDKVFLAVVWFLLMIIFILFAYPILYVLIASFSTRVNLALVPESFSMLGYQAVFNYKAIWTGYVNSLFYAVLGTAISLALTIACAYPLSRRDMPGSNLIMGLFVFTMYFSGGLIPTYLVVRDLKLLNTIWAVILPGSLSVYNMIVMRTYFQNQIPDELLEASQLDGCTNMNFLIRICLPLSMPIIAVIGLYYAVAYWNSYFSAMIYLQSRHLYPLQIFLREILILNTMDLTEQMSMDPEIVAQLEARANVMKYALIVVASVPVMAIYPLVQRHFVKGVMIGAVKG